MLSFRDKADRGVVYFEGRLVGRRGEAELAQMRAERVWLINGALTDNLISVQQGRRLAAILIDDPVGLAGSGSDHAVLSKIEALTRAGIAVLIATRDPVAASRAPVIYRLSRGKLRRIKITAN